MGATGVKEGVVFYIWVGVFNLFVISQFWAFANDLYTEGQGRRLFPLIVLGSSFGALAGAQAAEHMFGDFKMSPYSLMTVAGVVLVFTAALLAYINAHEAKQSAPDIKEEATQPLSTEGAFELIRDDRYLIWIAVLTVLLNLVNTTGEYLLGRMLTEQAAARGLAGAAAKQFIGSFYAGYFTWVNAVSLMLQAFGVSRIIQHVGIRGSLVLPAHPGPDELFRPRRRTGTEDREGGEDHGERDGLLSPEHGPQALWLPTTREAKYKAKAAVDTSFARSGDVLSAGRRLRGYGGHEPGSKRLCLDQRPADHRLALGGCPDRPRAFASGPSEPGLRETMNPARAVPAPGSSAAGSRSSPPAA